MMKIDVIITSTCRKTIEKTVHSFFDNVSYSYGFNFIVHVDVKNPHYLPYLKKYLKDLGIIDFRINMSPKPHPEGLTEAVNYLYPRIKTPFYFNLEDDWIFLKKINMDKLIELMEYNKLIDIIIMNKEPIKKEAWLYHLSPSNAPVTAENINTKIKNTNLVKTCYWSFNPSLARTSTTKKMLPIPSNAKAETFFCNSYDQLFQTRGAYFPGQIGDSPIIRDIGRNNWTKLKRTIKKYFIKKNA